MGEQRRRTLLKTEHKKTNKKLLIFNIHLDHKGEKARAQSLLLVLRKMEIMLKPDESFFLIGDFNITEQSPGLQNLQLHLVDAYTSSPLFFGPNSTFNNFQLEPIPNKRIDYIFFKAGDIRATALAHLSPLIQGRYLSDHFLVWLHYQFTSL